ncbi:MAG: diiron oxygenase [Acidimicrobiales bacterium]
MTPSPMPLTAAKATRLVAASERQTLDPFTEVDWSVPIDDSAYHLPPEFLPLFGTAAWDAMTETERFAYSRHETASLCGAGIWFENVLMQVVLRHLMEIDVTDPSHRYLLVEVADECRHSSMFGEFIRRASTPSYRPALSPQIIEASASGGADRAVGYLLILAVEELLDACNRATMKDDRVHPVSRRIAKVHVLEEARHVSFAKTYLSEAWPTLAAEDRATAAAFAPVAVSVIADLIVNPDVYETLGIAGGPEMAKANPCHAARIANSLAGLTSFLEELGVINDETRPMWAENGLLAASLV